MRNCPSTRTTPPAAFDEPCLPGLHDPDRQEARIPSRRALTQTLAPILKPAGRRLVPARKRGPRDPTRLVRSERARCPSRPPASTPMTPWSRGPNSRSPRRDPSCGLGRKTIRPECASSHRGEPSVVRGPQRTPHGTPGHRWTTCGDALALAHPPIAYDANDTRRSDLPRIPPSETAGDDYHPCPASAT